MNKIDTSKRSDELEIMDNFELKGPELEKTLDDLDKINKWLGGNKITLQGIKKLLKNQDKNRIIHVVDVGCGNGAILRKIAEWGRDNNYDFKLNGIDANPHAIKIGKKRCRNYPEIDLEVLNVFSETYKERKFDIVLCTLTLHHFKTSAILELMDNFYLQSRLGVVINDLHRSKLAYVLFQAFCGVFIKNEIAKQDGLRSILRGFKRKELEQFKNLISAGDQEIEWKWAFRYQWLLKKVT